VVNLIPLLRSRKISVRQKVDAFLLLFIYCVPPILLSGIAADALLFYMGAIPVIPESSSRSCRKLQCIRQFAPVFEVGAAELLDGGRERIYLLPCLMYMFSLQ